MYPEYEIHDLSFRRRQEARDIREVLARVRGTVRQHDKDNRELGATDQQLGLLFGLLESVCPEGIDPGDWTNIIVRFFGYNPKDLGVVEAQAMLSWLCPPGEECVSEAAAWEALAIYNAVTRATVVQQEQPK